MHDGEPKSELYVSLSADTVVTGSSNRDKGRHETIKGGKFSGSKKKVAIGRVAKYSCKIFECTNPTFQLLHHNVWMIVIFP